jgi:hypothetical protein
MTLTSSIQHQESSQTSEKELSLAAKLLDCHLVGQTVQGEPQACVQKKFKNHL